MILLKHVYMGQKFTRTLKLSMSFTLEHFFISVAIPTHIAPAPVKTLSVLKICFFSNFFDHVGKRLDEKTKFNFKIDDVMNWKS